MLSLTGGEALYRTLLPERVPYVFGVAGGKLGRFMQALARGNAINYVGTRHEASGAFMAAATFAQSGQISVAMGEVGPGAVNLASGVAHAFSNNLALLAVTSNNQLAASYPGRGMMMELDTASLFKPLTKWSAVVQDGRRIPELVQRAFREALSGRPGPVHLDFPQNILAGTFEFDEAQFPDDPGSYRPIGRPRAPAEQIEQAAALLSGAKRPLLIGGGGVARSGAEDSFRMVGTQLGAAMTATQMGIGAVASNAPGFIGHGGIIGGPAIIQALREADVVLAVGCRFSSWLWDNAGVLLRPPQNLIQIDVDPGMIGRVTPVTVGLQGDAQAVLSDLSSALSKLLPIERPQNAWLRQLLEARTRGLSALNQLAEDPSLVMHAATLAREIGALLPSDALVAYDGAHTSFWTNDFTPATAPRTKFHDPGMGQLGFGLPYALALKLSNPDLPVVNITGDGSFGFTVAELDTARRYKLPVVTIIHNNAEWGVIKFSQQRSDFTLGVDLEGTDYAAIAKGFGCYAEVVTQKEEIGPALRRAFASGLPAVLDCRVRFTPHPAMPDFGRMGQYNI